MLLVWIAAVAAASLPPNSARVAGPDGQAVTISCPKGSAPLAMAPGPSGPMTVALAGGEQRIIDKPVATCLPSEDRTAWEAAFWKAILKASKPAPAPRAR